MSSADRPGTRLATRIAFLVAGFGIACWAPLVPFAKRHLAVDDGVMGLLLLCLGVGSVLAMLLTGAASARYGSRPIILASCIALAMLLPLLAAASTPLTLALSLLVFGAALGSLDVAMNIHAVDVERAAPRPLMSGFHGLFSVGGFAGSALMTFLLSTSLAIPVCASICAGLMLLATLVSWPLFLRQVTVPTSPASVVPRGVVLWLAVLAGITFLAEGAVLDWGALLLTGAGLVGVAHGGVGYIVFSLAMTAGRLSGDRVVARIGDRNTLFWGGWFAIAGFLIVVTAPLAAIGLTGFLLIGLGASNIVPVLFRRAGSQKLMPSASAVAAISLVGYAGVLLGPASIGLLARATGLRTAFGLLAALFLVVTLAARRVTRTD